MLSERQLYILPFSAKSREALENTSSKVISYLKENDHINLADAAWTLQKGRRIFGKRKAYIAGKNAAGEKQFHLCCDYENAEEQMPNLVMILPGTADADVIWKYQEAVQDSSQLPDEYVNTIKKLLDLLPEDIKRRVTTDTAAGQLVTCIRTFIGGYASAAMLMNLGVQPTALCGTGIGYLTALALAGSLRLEDAAEIIQSDGDRDDYERVLSRYHLNTRNLPIIKKAGIKGKAYLEQARIIKLGDTGLENDIVRKCMTEINGSNMISLIEHPADDFISNVCNLLGRLWAKGIIINWNEINRNASFSKMALPSYAFDKTEFISDVSYHELYTTGSTADGDDKSKQEHAIINPSEVLKDLWMSVLGADEVKGDDDFFEIGGCSLTAIMLSSKIKEKLKVSMSISDMFQFSTFKKMQNFISSHAVRSEEECIEKLGRQSFYEASSAQRRMYMTDEMIEDAIPYNFAAIFRLHGNLDKIRLQECFAILVQRHEAFRTSFKMINGEVVQIIENDINFEVKYQTADRAALNELIKSEIKPFDLSKAPLLRVAIFSLNSQEHVMVLDMHHIIADQSSLDVLVKEINAFYRGQKLPELEIQYKDFAKWQNDFFRSGKVEKQLNYWKKEYENGIPVLDLYTDYERPEIAGHKGYKTRFDFPEELNREILTFSKQQGITPYMLIMGALNIMLWRYTNQNELVVGTAVAGRRHAKLESIIGMFVNTLAIKSEINEELTLTEYLSYIKQKMISAYDNQDCQYDMLLEELKVPKSLSRNPMFDIMFNYINMGTGEVEIDGLTFEAIEDKEIDVKYDICIILEENAQRFFMDIEYSNSLYKEKTIELMGDRLLFIITDMLQNPLKCLKDMTIMTPEEQAWIINMVNQTETNYPAEQTVLSLFEQCVRDDQDAIAVEWLDEKISYRQLNTMANQLAALLAKKKIGYRDQVALLLDRGFMQVVCMLGIMKVGAAYVPIDPTYPHERIEYILNDCKSKTVITNYVLAETLSPEIDKLLIDAPENLLKRDEDSEIESEYTPEEYRGEDLIYSIYTSGSTGKPKGTLLEHRNVIRILRNEEYVNITKEDRIIQFSNYVFDGSVFDFYAALVNGCTLVMIPREISLELPLLIEFINTKRISIFLITAALFHMLVDWDPTSLKNVRKVLVCGEQVSLSHAQRAVRAVGKGKFINGYGPTETGVLTTYYPIDDVEEAPIIPIGYPIANTKVYVVGGKQELLPINVAGELYIGGDGLGRGYLNNEELSKERFVNLDAIGGKRVYRTGDKVMWNSERELVFLGRIDFQIKLRGFRVELGEIERHIENIEGVRTAIVTAEKDNLGMLYMTAYYTINNYDQKDKFDDQYVRDALAKKIPEYMLPAKYMVLKEFPLNINGKVDRKALPKATDAVIRITALKDEPRSALENTVLKSMQKVLNMPSLGIKDDFFRCGGQSIKAIALVKDLSDQGIKVRVNDVFKYQTAERIALSIEPFNEQTDMTALTAESEEKISLDERQLEDLTSFIIAGLNNISNLIKIAKKSTQFKMSAIQKMHLEKNSDYSGMIMNLSGDYSEYDLRAAVSKVVCNNQLLHCTVSECGDGYCWQDYHIGNLMVMMRQYLTYVDLLMYEESKRESIKKKLSDAILLNPYAKGDFLWRACIIREEVRGYVIYLGADHLIFDAMSGEILKRQIENELHPHPSVIASGNDYKDYVELLEKGPVGITEQELIEKLKLEKWSEYNTRLISVPNMDFSDSDRSVTLVYPLPQNGQADIWNYAFNIASDILKRYLNSEIVPFVIVNYGRSYQDSEFYDLVGECLDMIPVISEPSEKEMVEAAVSLCKDHAVNFLTLLGTEHFQEKFPRLNKLLGKYFNNQKGYFDFIFYNYQGFVTAEEKMRFEHSRQDGSLAHINVVVNYDNENLYVEIEDQFGLNMSLINNGYISMCSEGSRNES